jgi:hypothetical protein
VIIMAVIEIVADGIGIAVVEIGTDVGIGTSGGTGTSAVGIIIKLEYA